MEGQHEGLRESGFHPGILSHSVQSLPDEGGEGGESWTNQPFWVVEGKGAAGVVFGWL